MLRSILIVFLFVTLLSAPKLIKADDPIRSVQQATEAVKPDDDTRTDKLGDPLEKHVLHRFGTRRFQHPNGVLELCLSGDEKTIMTFSGSETIGWDANSGKRLWTVERGQGIPGILSLNTGYGLRVMAKARNTGEVISIRVSQNIPIWNPRTGEITELDLPDASVNAKAIDISPNGKLIALGSSESLQVYSRDGKQLFERANNPAKIIADAVDDERGFASGDRLAFTGEFSYARFAPNGKVLALVNSEKPTTLQILDARTGAAIREIATTGRIVRFVFSPDSASIATTERDVAVRLYDVQQAERTWETKLTPADGAENYTSAIDFHPDGSQIAVGAILGPDKSVRLLNAKTGNETKSLGYPGWRPWSLHYSSDGSTLLSSGWNGTVHRWNTITQELLPLLGGIRATSVCSIAAKGGVLAFADSSGTIHIADVDSAETIRELAIEGISWSNIQFNPDGSMLAAGGVDKKKIHLVIWNVADETESHHWSWDFGRDPHSSIHSLSFSGNQIAATVFRQNAAYVWNLTTDQQVAKVKQKGVFGASLNEGKLVTVGWDKRIVEWDSTSGESLRSLKTAEINPGDSRMYKVRVSKDRSMMATSDMNSSIRIYDRDWKEQVVIPNAGSSQQSFALSRNGLWVSWASSRLHVFDVASGDSVFSVFRKIGHLKTINSIEFGPRDRTILTGGEDGVCNLWKFPPPDLPIDDDELFDNLIGKDGKKAFKAFKQLDTEPDRAAKLLEIHLAGFSETEVSKASVRKPIIALGSGDESRIEKAENSLFELGPGVVPLLQAQLESGKLSEAKKTLVSKLAFTIHRRYRRASMLLAQLESTKADSIIERLVKASKSKRTASFFEEIAKYRQSLR